MPDLLIIEHRTDGRQYAVTPANYRKVYADQGFKPLQFESGKPYEEPKAEAAASTTTKRKRPSRARPKPALAPAPSAEPTPEPAVEPAPEP